MRARLLLAAAATAAAIHPLAAQANSGGIMIMRSPANNAGAFRVVRAMASESRLGFETNFGSATARDTLGILISDITTGGPADKAGIEEGTRIAAINGVSLRLAPADVGDVEMAAVMEHRLTRQLDAVKTGDDVKLTLYAAGQTRTIAIKAGDLGSPRVFSLDSTLTMFQRGTGGLGAIAAEDRERSTLGVEITATGTKRDTLGVFVVSVIASGPADKAGIEEGSRIVSINGVDLRVSHEDAGDDAASQAKVDRLQREAAKVKAGDVVSVKVLTNGQLHDVKVTAVRADELSGDNPINRLYYRMGTRPPVVIRDSLPRRPR